MVTESIQRKTLTLLIVMQCGTLSADGWNPITEAPNNLTIGNTRHNLTMSYLPAIAGGGAIMDNARNNYFEICVYCHTPHGANRQVNAPLWNRTINQSSYLIYDKPRTLNRPIGQPGPNSLTCLSCHDGTISIDSIINMPGSGKYDAAQETTVNTDFLNSWENSAAVHATLGGTPGSDQECTYCHSESGGASGFPFENFVIGVDLRDDHPIGIQFPTSFNAWEDFRDPTLTYTTVGGALMKVFDTNNNGQPDTNEARLYDSGDGPEVECASCHDPHGVPSGADGSTFNPSFLRINNGITGSHPGVSGMTSNRGSALCLTCHVK